jgi:hypothetical protein
MAQETSKEAASLVRERYDRWAKVNMAVLLEMEHSCLMYSNEQWNMLQGSRSTGGRWTPSPRPRNRVRLTVNKLPALVETMVDTYMRERPIISTSPPTTTEIDKRSAKIGELLLKHSWDIMYFSEKLIEALTWVGITGSSFGFVGWDEHAGRGTQQQDGSSKPQGQPSLEIVSPFSLAIETGASKFDDAGWYVRADIRDIYSIEKQFNQKVEPDAESFDMTGFHPQLTNINSLEEEDRARLYTMYERPTSKHKNGRKVWICNDKRIHQEDLPLDAFGNAMVEIVMFTGVQLPGQLYPTSLCTMATPSQIELNKTKSQLLEYRNYATRPMLVAPETAFTGQPEIKVGGILKWDDRMAQHEPKFMSPPTISGDIHGIVASTEADIMDVASQHASRAGKTSGSINSAKQAKYLSASDESRLTPSVMAFQSQLSKIGKYTLSNYERHLSGEELLYIVGQDRKSDVYEFKANEISAQCNVTYDIVSKLPWSKENTRQQAMWLKQQGLIDDETLKSYLDISTPTEVYEFERTHRENARQENKILEQQYFPPLPTDNHLIHIEEHKQSINNPELRALFIEEMLSQKQGEAAMASLGQQPQGAAEQFPLSLKHKLEHINEHQGMIPKAQAPAPAAKVNLSLDRLMMHPAIAANPQLMQQLLQIAQDIALDAASFDSAPSGAEKPPSGGSGPSPSGGYSGELYSAATGTIGPDGQEK